MAEIELQISVPTGEFQCSPGSSKEVTIMGAPSVPELVVVCGDDILPYIIAKFSATSVFCC